MSKSLIDQMFEDSLKTLEDLFSNSLTDVKQSNEILSKDKETVIEVPLAGVPKEDIQIKAEDKGTHQLVTVKVKDKKTNMYKLYDIDRDKIEACYKDGLLKITVPKSSGRVRDIPLE